MTNTNQYVGTRLQNNITVDELYTLHYFEYSKGFRFPGESHDFWEMVYIDKGEAIVTAGDRDIPVSHGDIVFHPPGQWHTIRSEHAANSVIFSFRCTSPALQRFSDRKLTAGNSQKKIISRILAEGMQCFEGPFGDPYSKRLIRRQDAPLGSEQLIHQYLCELLILCIRDTDKCLPMSSLKSRTADTAFDEIEAYMQQNIDRKLTLAEIAAHANISVSTLREIFHNVTSGGAIDYFITLKVERAKWYIRDGNYSITQISELLGYSSPHYFSRQFRSKAGMSPLQYAKSVQSLLSGNIQI